MELSSPPMVYQCHLRCPKISHLDTCIFHQLLLQQAEVLSQKTHATSDCMWQMVQISPSMKRQ